MNLDLDYTPNLDDSAIYTFVLDNTRTTFSSPAPTLAGYGLIKSRDAGSSPISLYAAVREFYDVWKYNSVVGSFDVIVPVEQSATLTIHSNLLVKNGLADDLKARLITAFDGYDPTSGEDPRDYAARQLTGGLTADMFAVISSFTIDKVGAADFKTGQRDALISLYAGTLGNGSTLDVYQDTKLDRFLVNNGFAIKLIRTDQIGRPAPTPKDPVHELDVTNAGDTSPIGGIVAEEKAGLDCQIYEVERVEERIATLLQYPEFKIEWEQKELRIGCIRVVITLPALYTRTAKRVLYAYVGRPHNILQVLLDQIKVCAIKAAIAGTVIGVVLANFAAGLAAFRAVFEQCIEFNAGQYVQCLVPGLAILSEATAWTRV